jgi:hypothetical protein
VVRLVPEALEELELRRRLVSLVLLEVLVELPVFCLSEESQVTVHFQLLILIIQLVRLAELLVPEERLVRVAQAVHGLEEHRALLVLR